MAKAVPASVYCHWRDTANAEFPGLKTTPANFAVACNALLQFFHMAAMEKSLMMLPSKAADSVWHTWTAHDSEGLSSFLKTYVGKDIPHVEREAMPKEGANNPAVRMADTWRAAHEYDNNLQFSGKLPSIFEADKLTKIPNGFWYDRDQVDKRAGYFHAMDSSGQPDMVRRGGEMLSWYNVYEVMTPAQRAKVAAQIETPREETVQMAGKHGAVMAALGLGVGTTAAFYLASQEATAQEVMANKERQFSGGDGGVGMAFGSGDGGSSCGGCGGG